MSHATPPVFMPLKIDEVRMETHELVHLGLSGAPADFKAAYTIPGQYVQIKAGGIKPGFFALASAPGEDAVELLIKRGSPISDAIVATNKGEALEVSAPAGKCYPFAQAKGSDLFLVGVGSGIAPLRAVLRTIQKNRGDFKRVVFIYGARTSTAFPYCSEMDSWKKANIEVTCVCSQPHAGTWNGPVGRVQDILLKEHRTLAPQTSVFACGMKAMVEDVKAAFAKLGLPAERVYQNF